MKRVLALGLSVMLLLSACGRGNAPSTGEQTGEGDTTSVQPGATGGEGVSEVPYLSDRVTAGELPAMIDRLPEAPFVETVPEIGVYGGTIRHVYTGVSDWNNLNYMAVRNELLVSVAEDGTPQPNLVEEWEYIEDGEDCTLRIKVRNGLRWSDGEPFTIDAVIYDLETRFLDTMPLERNGIAAYIKADEITRIDDHTADFPMTSKYPIEFGATFEQCYAPQHYLQQFDPRYDNTRSWDDLATAWCSQTNSEQLPGLPQMSPWVVTSLTDNGLIVAERNPYYWKVDQAGNQLPYIDRIEFTYVATSDSIPAMVQAGEIDFQVRHMQFSDYALYKQNEEAGGYITKALTASTLGPCIRLNYAHEDPAVRALFRELDFRKALALGIDRKAISDSLYYGLVEPWGDCALDVASSYPGDAWKTMFTEYDPEQARQLLDRVGLVDTNNDGIRELNGSTFTLVLDAEQGSGSGPVQGVELIAEQLRGLGIDTVVNTIERTLMLARWQDNSYSAYVWKLDGANDPVRFSYAWAALSDPGYLWHNVGVPMQAWWHSGGTEGVEMPQFVIDINETMETALSTLDAGARAEIGMELNKLHAENLFVIPTTTFMELGIVSNRLRNVPQDWVSGNEYVGEKHTRPWVFYYAQ